MDAEGEQWCASAATAQPVSLLFTGLAYQLTYNNFNIKF
jgi:hypothetical protein